MATTAKDNAWTAAALRQLGWKVTNADDLTSAVECFQLGYALGDPLLVDGKPGPRTRAAIKVSLDRRKAARPDASPHFSFREFRCRCGGRYKGCLVILVRRELLAGLEDYRVIAGPVAIESGYRCPTHNAKVGGASSSQHVNGAAADVRKVVTTTAVKRLRRFSGIGQAQSTKKVRHVDVRHAAVNTTGGTPDKPTIWNYPT